MAATVRKWEIFESAWKGPADGNPFVDVTLTAEFRHGGRRIAVGGFYDGDGVYRIRFMPDETGSWDFATHSNAPALDGRTGSFACREASPDRHGPVQVRRRFHFAYADGTPYIPVGTTCYAWVHQGEELERQTLRTLAASPFNKLRMCVFPKHYDYNHNEPPLYPFEGSAEKGWDFTRFRPAFFRHLEERIAGLGALHIQADVILLHPYDRWGFAAMGAENDDRYLRYAVIRLAPFENVWWSLANEFDFMAGRDMSDWDRYFRIVQENDPYAHLRSVHNGRIFYDYGKPWVTHCSIQYSDLSRVDEWRRTYGKPVVVDECGYEGNIGHMWGNLTPQQMVCRFWEGFCRGGYVGHGETYVHPEDILWWAKGGRLSGKSPARIAFLQKILEEDAPKGLEPASVGRDIRAVAGRGDAYFLGSCGEGQSDYKDLQLPEGRRYRIDILDTWNMTVTSLPGEYEGRCRIPLGGRPYLAVRIRKIG